MRIPPALGREDDEGQERPVRYGRRDEEIRSHDRVDESRQAEN
jgi:hypothetical protein